MIQTNLAYDYVNNIPWAKNPAFAFSDDSERYLQAFRNAVDKIPVKDSVISFSDNVWDFNPYFDGINDNSYRISFENIPAELVEYSKFFILYKIMGKMKISTANVRYSNAISVIKEIYEKTNHKNIYLITLQDVKTVVNGRNVSYSTQHNLYEGLYQYCHFLKYNYQLDIALNLDALKRVVVETYKKDSNEDTKLSDIPEEYFNKIFNTAVRLMRDEACEYNKRASACMLVMLSELGMRTGDLMAIRADSLHSKKLANGFDVNYIHYTARKPSKSHSPLLEFDMYSSSYCTEAFKTLLEIRKQCKYKDEPYLYVLNDKGLVKNSVPVHRNRFHRNYENILFEELKEDALRDWEGIKKTKYTLFGKQYENNKYQIDLSVPDTRQFRVHCCTRLYEMGVPLVYIQRYMSHLSEYMLGYYVRPKDTYQENIAYSEKVIKEIAGDDITPLGLLGEDIKENIKKFIEENGFNVKTDIDDIIKAVGDKVVIRGKTGGVCIKTSLMPCSKDARTNEMMCAYNICPNLFHFYYMADVSYINFMTLQDTYKANLERGQTKAAQKELHKIKDVLNRRLIPELDELEREISKKGVDEILSNYPSLRDIIDNRTNVRKEIEKWLMKK